MKKLIEFLRVSNRWKHLLGGALVGLCALGAWTAVYAAVIAGSCLELKDRLRGCRWDWTDWVLTVAGGGITAIIWLLV